MPVIKTPLTRWFDLTTPVIGAPMAGVAGGELARAVSLGGGLGMIGVSGATSAEFLAAQCAIPAASEVPFGGFRDCGYGKKLSGRGIGEHSRFGHAMVKPELVA